MLLNFSIFFCFITIVRAAAWVPDYFQRPFLSERGACQRLFHSAPLCGAQYEQSYAAALTIVICRDTLMVHEVKDINVCPRLSISSSRCRLIDTVVHLQGAHNYIQNIIPNQVTVPRCYSGSHCNGNYKCLPSKTHMKPFKIHYTDWKFNHKYKCGEINVTVHDQCKCQCDISRSECEAKGKIFNAAECTCECDHQYKQAKKDCKNYKTMEWDEDKCECVCTSEIMTCNTGEKWFNEVCGCRRYEILKI